jgi:Uncharacterized metal-binding protein
MGTKRSVIFEPWGVEGSTSTDATILELAEQEDIGIEALCGGEGICGTCTVQVEAGETNLTAVTDAERAVLSDSEIEAGKRLGCEARIQGGQVSVFVPPKSRIEQAVIMTAGRSFDIERRPAARAYPLELEAPTLADTVADRERIVTGLADEYDVSISTVDRLGLQSLPNKLREGNGGETLRVTPIVYRDDHLL